MSLSDFLSSFPLRCRYDPAPDSPVTSAVSSDHRLKGFLLFGETASVISSCDEIKDAAWALNLSLQSTLKVDMSLRDTTVFSSSDLRLLFYGPHARDSCKVWAATIHRVAQASCIKWGLWEKRVRALILSSGKDWLVNQELVRLMQSDGEVNVCSKKLFCERPNEAFSACSQKNACSHSRYIPSFAHRDMICFRILTVISDTWMFAVAELERIGGRARFFCAF
jgi:hypothetical protein